MAKRYFTNFPEINYNNFTVKDITVSAQVINKYVNLPYTYQAFEIDGERPDQIANEFYDDSYMSWIIFYANKTVDPYYEWFLNETDFQDFLIKKYGSVETSIKTILEFRPNWYDDNRELSVNQFNSMFGSYTAPHSKYWDTNYDDNGNLLSYTRKISNDVVNTNKLIKLKVDNDDDLETGDLLDIKVAPNGSTVGVAEVLSVSNTGVYIKNVLGDIANSYYLVIDSDVTNYAQIIEYSSDYDITADTWTSTNIATDEYIYWAPYTVFDMEREKNDQKRNVKMIDPAMALKIANSIEDELDGREL